MFQGKSWFTKYIIAQVIVLAVFAAEALAYIYLTKSIIRDSSEVQLIYFPLAGALVVGVILHFFFKIDNVSFEVRRFIVVLGAIFSWLSLFCINLYVRDVIFADVVFVKTPAEIDRNEYHRYYVISEFKLRDDIKGKLVKEEKMATGSINLKCYFPSPMTISADTTNNGSWAIWVCPNIKEKISGVSIRRDEQIKKFRLATDSLIATFDSYKTNVFVRETNSVEYDHSLQAIKTIPDIKLAKNPVLLMPYIGDYESWKRDQESTTGLRWSLGITCSLIFTVFMVWGEKDRKEYSRSGGRR